MLCYDPALGAEEKRAAYDAPSEEPDVHQVAFNPGESVVCQLLLNVS